VYFKARRKYVRIGSTLASLLPTTLKYTDPTPNYFFSCFKTFNFERRRHENGVWATTI